MFERRWVRNNKIIVAIVIYIILYSLINILKPSFMYNPDGSIKQFGVGYRKKTIIPVEEFEKFKQTYLQLLEYDRLKITFNVKK